MGFAGIPKPLSPEPKPVNPKPGSRPETVGALFRVCADDGGKCGGPLRQHEPGNGAFRMASAATSEGVFEVKICLEGRGT